MIRSTLVALLVASAPAAHAGERRVIDLDKRPHACVRLDRAVTYVGTPGADQRCPAHVVGRARATVTGAAVGPAAAARTRVPRVAVQLTGAGFDACTAPSSAAMDAWLSSSPYRTVGVYIGGLNRGCAQPNLTAAWVSEQAAGGWSFIPTYVGRQAPTSSCGSCAAMSASQAAAQGTAEADDAVTQAAALGFGAGTPIYFDLEHYQRGTSASRTVMTFLDAWTERLHARRYVSGVYSSASSGITELVAAEGGPYTLPDDLWIANWNGQATTDDPYVPDELYVGRRIHQYRGGHQETYGGVTINIDNDWIGGDVAIPGVGSAAPDPYAVPPPPPCVVPKLTGKTFTKARTALRRKGCRVGYVRRQGSGRRFRVARQQYRAGTTRKALARVGVSLRPTR